MYVYLLNNYYNGGSDDYYTFNIEDTTSNTSCYTSNANDYGYDTNPDHAYYIVEDPNACSSNSECTLASFNTVPFTATAWDDYNLGDNEGLNTAYSANHYGIDYMTNGVESGSCTSPVNNTEISSTPGSDGAFTVEYKSSSNTPGGCQP